MSDWVSTLVTGIVGIAGVAGTAWGSSRSRRHDERMARASTQEAQRAWHRDNRAAAYVEYQEIADRVGHVVAMVHPMVDTIPPAPVPPLPTPDEQAHAGSRLKVFGSESVKEAYATWDTIVRTALRTAEAIGRDSTATEERRDLHRLRDEELRARSRLAKAMAEDLAGPAD